MSTLRIPLVLAASAALLAPLAANGVLASSLGAPSTPAAKHGVVINEVETNGDDNDWVELFNPTYRPVDLGGYTLRDDSGKHAYTIPRGTVLEPEGFQVINQKTATERGFDFGLGSSDEVRLLDRDGQQVASEHWDRHAKVTWGRCPDGAGDLRETGTSTRGGPNDCTQPPAKKGERARPWPGSAHLENLDAADENRSDWSGLDHQPAPDGGPGTLWAVENGHGWLYRLTSVDGEHWKIAEAWTLRYPDGTGTVDAEGVSVSSDGVVQVATERDNRHKDTSRPSVLRVDPEATPGTTDPKDTDLVAQQEWNLAGDYPGLGANSGPEAVEEIPDSWLTKQGFVDQSTGRRYDPASYPGHGDALSAVGVEGTGTVDLYALDANGGHHRVASTPSRFPVVAGLDFDAERNRLWVACDDACDGRTATFTVGKNGQLVRDALYERPLATQNYANEGFAIADGSQCRGGQIPVYFADDNNTDGHSLRRGGLRGRC